MKKLAEQLRNNEEESYELIIQRQKLAYLFEKTYYKDTPDMFDSLPENLIEMLKKQNRNHDVKFGLSESTIIQLHSLKTQGKDAREYCDVLTKIHCLHGMESVELVQKVASYKGDMLKMTGEQIEDYFQTNENGKCVTKGRVCFIFYGRYITADFEIAKSKQNCSIKLTPYLELRDFIPTLKREGFIINQKKNGVMWIEW